jgi:hypothetical protein
MHSLPYTTKQVPSLLKANTPNVRTSHQHYRPPWQHCSCMDGPAYLQPVQVSRLPCPVRTHQIKVHSQRDTPHPLTPSATKHCMVMLRRRKNNHKSCSGARSAVCAAEKIIHSSCCPQQTLSLPNTPQLPCVTEQPACKRRCVSTSKTFNHG